MSDTRTPVTVLTGFLGSDKTTLLNYILTVDHGQRIAVIENEFGEIAVDDALVLNAEEEIFELSNGCCLCCTGRTDLIRMLRTLAGRRHSFDRVLIETTGLADPNPVAQTFFVDEEIAKDYALDAIVTLVDAKHIGAHLDEVQVDGVGDQVYDQIAFADRLVVNKVDLVDEPDLEALGRRLRAINASADIIRSCYAQIDLRKILGIGAFDLSRTISLDPDWLDDTSHLHDRTLSSAAVEIDGDLDPARVQAWLAGLVAERGEDLYRFKGILALRGEPQRFVLQGVHHTYDLAPAAPWADERRASKVVLIGRDVDHAALTEGLTSCLAADVRRVGEPTG